MDDREILQRIHDLVAQERSVRADEGRPDADREADHQELQRIEQTLDQCWDLLRQRRARREFGEDADGAEVRPEGVVEGYQQ
ncbi:DUF2630 family protein [Nakamurella sp. YIM 132087]|uniref:DUF2630 family protein n=1 Tax=Nakamurella alba TaxID=2665158 RepID=A0A7K1FIG0_9ACTN|nr:DUF2630 family protein [Nakamurella alba]MTD13053.1 DUF2630 family protein [Nakamurella alba]